MAFLILEDNGGSYHWKILAGDGAILGQSGDFASYDAANEPHSRSATVPPRRVSTPARVGPAQSIWPHVALHPTTTPTPSAGWTKAGLSSEAVSQWPAPR